MSHVAPVSFLMSSASTGVNTDPAKVRTLVDTALDLLTPQSTLAMLDGLLRERVRTEFQRLATTPDWLRGLLESGGDVLALQLLQANWPHVGRTAYVTEKYGIPRSSLHRGKDAGVIAYRPTDQDDFVFPLEQFGPRTVHPWAATIIQAVGNGSPALHFLYVPRLHLGKQSFAEALRAPKGRDVPALIGKAATRLSAE